MDAKGKEILLLALLNINIIMVQEGTNLALTALGEMTENWMNFSRGAFNWWNLLQIPVELIVGKMLKTAGFTDLESYAGKKLASALTAVGVGAVAAGPFGALGSLAFWFATEIITCILKQICSKVLGMPLRKTSNQTMT